MADPSSPVSEVEVDVGEQVERIVRFSKEAFGVEMLDLAFHPMDPACASDAKILEALEHDLQTLRKICEDNRAAFDERVKTSGLPEKYHEFCWAYLLHRVEKGRTKLVEALEAFEDTGTLPEHREYNEHAYLKQVYDVWGNYLQKLEAPAKRARSE